MRTDKENLAWEIDYHARHDDNLDRDRRLANALIRARLRQLETLVAALSRPATEVRDA